MSRSSLTSLRAVRPGGLLAVAVWCSSGCASAPLTQRFVDTPVGVGHELGAPKNKVYSVDVETEKDALRITVFEQSECDRIRVRIVSRVEESVRGDDVVGREPLGPVQIAEGSDGVAICDQRFARGAQVSLQIGTATHRLGRANPFGEVEVSLSDELKQSLYGESTPKSGTLIVERQEVGVLSLAELAKHESRTNQLVAEFQGLLDRPELGAADISRAYVIYEQLRLLDRGDARISALSERFLELQYGRKQAQATETLKRNLEALKGVKELLAAGAREVPMFVQVAVQSGETSASVLRWARGQLVVSARSAPAFCQSNFTWAALSSYDPSTQLALGLLRYAYDDGFEQDVRQLCARLRSG